MRRPQGARPARIAGRAGLWVLVLAVLALAGCGGSGAGEETKTIDRDETIEAGSFVELNLAMNESAELTYRWETMDGAELAFDVHSHTPDGVEYHEQATGASGEGSFTAPSEGTYSLLWENTGEDPAAVTIHVEGDLRLESVAP